MSRIKEGYFDALEFIIQYEAGNVTEEEMIEGFKQLVQSGQIRSLQGSYQRTAQQLIDSGAIVLPTQGQIYGAGV